MPKKPTSTRTYNPLDSMAEDLGHIYGLANPPGVQDAGETKDIDPRIIKPNPFQPRKYFDPVELERLGQSMKGGNQIHPILVTIRNGEVILGAGERRVRAAIQANLPTVQATIRDLTDEQLEAIALDENILRKDLPPLDEAYGLQSYMRRHHLDSRAAAELRGYDHATILNRLALLRYEPITQAVAERRMRASTAATLAKQLKRCPDATLRDAILAKLEAKEEIGPNLLDRLDQALAPARPPTPSAISDPAAPPRPATATPPIAAPEAAALHPAAGPSPLAHPPVAAPTAPLPAAGTPSPVPASNYAPPPGKAASEPAEDSPILGLTASERDEADAIVHIQGIQHLIQNLRRQLGHAKMQHWITCLPTELREAHQVAVAALQADLADEQQYLEPTPTES